MTQDEAVWYRVELMTSEPEPAASALWDAGALGVEIQDRQTYMDDGSISPVPEGQARLIAFFDTPFEAQLSVAHELISNQRYDDRSWETAWMKYFRPVRISARSVVGPPWEEFDAPEGGVKIVIEPGMAFGTGTHETTGVCSEIIDELVASDAPASMLDVGCGTAVLSMLARGLGVTKVEGIDHDPVAIEVASENLEKNGFNDIAVSTKALGEFGEFDLVVANILGHILLRLRDDLHPRVASGGKLLVSGVTTDQADAFLEEFASPNFTLVERRDRGEWAAFLWQRR